MCGCICTARMNKINYYSRYIIVTAEVVWKLQVRMKYVKNVQFNIHISIGLLDINLNNYPTNQAMSSQHLPNTGPASQTVSSHWANARSTPRVCWITLEDIQLN